MYYYKKDDTQLFDELKSMGWTDIVDMIQDFQLVISFCDFAKHKYIKEHENKFIIHDDASKANHGFKEMIYL